MAAEYVPELNNIERCWRDLKQNHLANRTFTDVDDLDRTIHQAVNDLNRERKPLSSAKDRRGNKCCGSLG
jgi:transposase